MSGDVVATDNRLSIKAKQAMNVKQKPSVDLTYSIPFLSHLSWMNPLTFQVSKLCISFCTAHVESLISANGLEIDSLLLVINVVVVEREN